MLTMLTCTTFTSSGSDDEEDFNYSLETLYGTWEVQEAHVDNKWIDVTVEPYTHYGMSATFYADGKYFGI